MNVTFKEITDERFILQDIEIGNYIFIEVEGNEICMVTNGDTYLTKEYVNLLIDFLQKAL
jgi:hypothetical protein